MNRSQHDFRSCFDDARAAQATRQFPLALRLYRRCIRMGERPPGKLPRCLFRQILALAKLRHAEMLIYSGSISRGAELGLLTLRRLANELPALRLPKQALADVTKEMYMKKDVFALHKSDLRSQPLWTLEPELFEAVLHVISKHDPVGITSRDDNIWEWTEYAHEVDAILPRLKRASCAADVYKAVTHVFRDAFNYYYDSGKPMPLTPSAVTLYRNIADEIWKVSRRPKLKKALANIADIRSPIADVVRRLRKSIPKLDEKLCRALIVVLYNEALRLSPRGQRISRMFRKIFGETDETD